MWKDIPGYEGLYQVDETGNVKSLRSNTRIRDKEQGIMSQKLDNKGYRRVNLSKDGVQKSELVSRLVAKTYIPNPNNYPEVGHNDDCKLNNSVDNLYWTTRQENLTHNDLHLKIRDIRSQGGIERVKEALSISVTGTNIETGEEIHYKSMQEATADGFDSGKISMCCSGKRNMHHGYKWRKDK